MAEMLLLQPSIWQPIFDMDLEHAVQNVFHSVGLEKRVEELEAIVLSTKQADKFKTIGIKPQKECIMYSGV